MRFLPAIALLLALHQGAYSYGGLSLTVSLPFTDRTSQDGAVYGLSYYLPSQKIKGFHEFGLMAKPFGEIEKQDLSSRGAYETWAALVTGHLFLLSPWIRPGFQVGPLYGKTASLRDGEPHFESDIGAYFAFELHLLFVTFVASNLSLGAGVNFSL